MGHPRGVKLPRVFAAGLWLAVTVSSTAMVWAATSIVAADVTDRPPSAIAHADVVSELASGPTGPPTTLPSPPPSTTTTAPTGGRATTSTTLLSQARQPTVTVAPAAPLVTTPTTAPAPVPVTRPTVPPTTQPAHPTATYSTTGGVVRVSCDGFLISLLSAIPTNGYSVKVVVGGPVSIEVHFVRSGQDFSVKAVCFGQPIRYDGLTPPRQGQAASDRPGF